MAKYKIEIKKSAVKEISHLPVGDLKKVLNKIEALSENPRPVDCQKLCAQEKYRVRCGSYRVLYSIEDAVLMIYIVRVGHRREVYRL